MVRIPPERLRNDLFKLRFHFLDSFAGSKTGAIADPEHMGVDREGILAKGGVEHDISSLSANAGKLLQLFPSVRNLAAMAFDERLAQRNDVLGLGVEKPDRLDRFSKFVFSKIDHLVGRGNSAEDGLGSNVDPGVRRLCRKHHRDKERIGVREMELRGGRGVCLREPAKKFEDLVARHLRSSRARPRRESASSKS
jgi:hypothetical protein